MLGTPLSRSAAVFSCLLPPSMLPLHPSQAKIDDALAVALIVCGCPSRFHIVAPSRRLLEASLSVCPWHAAEPSHAPMTHQDEPRHAVAAAGPPDSGRLYRCRG